MATRPRNIPFSSAEQTAVYLASQLVEGPTATYLRKLHDKMMAAREPKPQSEEWDFSVQAATRIAKELLKDRVVFPPVLTPAWFGNKNKYIKANAISEETFRKGCSVAENKWSGPIYFDTLLGATNKLVATDAAGRSATFEKKGWRGFAAPEENKDE